MAQDTTSADGLFETARNEAFNNKNYTEAVRLSKKALLLNATYTDVIVFTGRIYAWNKQPDSARAYFEKALLQKPTPEDAYAGYVDLEFWNDNTEKALSLLQQGLSDYPQSVALLLRKAKILNAKKDFKQAILIVDTILKLDKNNTDARALASQIRDNISKNRIGIKYDYVAFDKQFPDPWQLVSIDYTRQTKAGAFTARVNYAKRFNMDGLQYELESYPRFSKTFYAYINTGYSNNVGVFPKWKAGASLYANLPKAFESELGIRYLYFTSNAFIYTLYVGKYYKSFLFGARTYLTPANSNISQSYSVIARYYYGGIDDYIGFLAGAGLSPDDNRVIAQLNSTYKLQTYMAELTLRHALRKLNIITANFSILNQEYRMGMKGNQLQAGIGYIRRF
ncbi:MAG: YaiO family outer membrane beta-barrel protein [Flavipsychrobacter sp.]